MTSIRLDSELDERVKTLAKATGRSKTHIINEAVRQNLEDLEDIYSCLHILENPGRIYTLEEAEEELDLARKT